MPVKQKDGSDWPKWNWRTPGVLDLRCGRPKDLKKCNAEVSQSSNVGKLALSAAQEICC